MIAPRPTADIRIRSQVSADEVESKVGKILSEDDFNVMPTRDCVVRKPDGKILCIYRRGIIPPALREQALPILQSFRNSFTSNRGKASGTPRVKGAGKRSYAMNVPSAIVGAFEAQGPKKFCRLTAWTGTETEEFAELWPLLGFIGDRMLADAPDRYAAQMAEVARTHPDWVIPGTPFTTVTINNTYPTGVHKDAGDLDAGISTLAVFRTGQPFRGGVLVFPEYRVGVEMQDGDLLLMDAHAFHGNTDFNPPVKRSMTGRLEEDPGFERISVVSYFRSKMTTCAAAGDEAEKRRLLAEERSSIAVGE